MPDPTARPKPGTLRMTAVCLRCNGVLYGNPPPFRRDWVHDDTGDEFCDPAAMEQD